MTTETETLLRKKHLLNSTDEELGYGGLNQHDTTTTITNDEKSSNDSQDFLLPGITSRQNRLLLAIVLILPYIGLVVALLFANNFDQDTIIEKYYFLPFHMYEFWGGVYFALVEGYVLLVADDSFLLMDRTSQSILVNLLSINIVSSTVAAALFTLDPEIFEVPSHFIEYATQLTITFIDAFFMFLPRNGSTTQRDRKKMGNWFPLPVQKAYFVVLVLADICKFLLYTDVIPTEIGNERSSHYVEFIVELLNSLWAFVYIKDLYMQTLRQQK